MFGTQQATLSWSFGGGFTTVPSSALEPVPAVPQKSGIAVSGAPTDRRVTFAIADNSTSEQRFDLYRKAAGAPDADYVKVNEAGINSPYVTDASAQPGTTYTYVLRGYNFASGAGEASDPVTVATAPAPAPRQGLHAYYYNDDYWGRGEFRYWPLAMDDMYVGRGGGGAGADVHEVVTTPSLHFGNDHHDPAVRPGGSPHPLIRDGSHSIVLAGKLLIEQSGEYEILGFGEDDTYVVVDNVITSAFSAGHTLFDPRPHPNPNSPGRFAHRVHLDAGPHDLLVLNNPWDGPSALELRWVRPGGSSAEFIPVANLSTAAAAPAAPGAPATVERRGTNALFALDDNATSEWKNTLVVARDADFTQEVRALPFGILVETGLPGGNPSSLRVFDLLPNTRYFAKHVALNGEGEAASPVTEFDTGPELVPATPNRFFARPRGPARSPWPGRTPPSTRPATSCGAGSVTASGGSSGPFTLVLNTLQGDADRRNGRVNANDVGFVRSRLNRTATETPPAGLAPYTAFVDLDANGRINANDVGTVRSRQNDFLPPFPVPAAATTVAAAGPALFGTRRIRPEERAAIADLLA